MALIGDWLASGPLLTDGGWGTQLQGLGLGLGECPDGWNLTHPEMVERVASAYVEAGSQVILTNTFRGNRISLAGYGLEGKTAEINRSGAAISKRAAAGRALVFASIGPTGKMLMTGEVSEQELLDAFTEQAQALADGGADALLVETMADIAEASAALRAARATGLPVVVSFVFDSGKNKDRTMMGSSPEQVVKAMEEAGADAIGANCGLGIEGYVPVAKRLTAATSLPVWIKANAGLPEMVADQVVYKTSAETFASHVPALIETGVSFVGGCCGTNPDFIKAAARVMKKQ